jgi:protein-S-isoprenylcysteine O-methyltransferase Ste14
METFLKYYLPVYFLVYLVVVFVLPTVRVYRQTGINPVTFGKTGNAHDYVGNVMKLLIILLLASIIVYSVSNQLYRHLIPVWYLEKEWAAITGLILIHISLLWTVIAQQQMGRSWRIGIDEKNRTDLVMNGVFSLSRNPVFLGMITTMTGLFLILPNAVSFFTALTGYLIIQVQIRLEEEFLLKQHGTAYEAYRKKVRRLL